MTLTLTLITRVIQLLLASMLFLASSAGSEELKLPNLGASSTSLFSPEQEYQLGRAWLRSFRSQAPIFEDPQLHDYLENLIYKLVTHSELEDRRVELVVVDNPVLNAFAVPGGVIGIHSGLMVYAQSEDELGAVLGHEIAHLSQRHFSRGVEHQKKQTPLTMAGLLAGLVLIATTGGSAGLAALSATQAAALESSLRFSRANEQEADRIGMQTMVEAGMDPHAAPAMYERMLYSSRYSRGNQVPEFLRTHPLSESRVADTRNRSRQYPRTMKEESLSFHLMRSRVRVHQAESPQKAIEIFAGSLRGKPLSPEAEQYGLVLALTQGGRAREAREQLRPLLDHRPEQLEYIIADAEIDLVSGEAVLAVRSIERQLQLYPGNHALTMVYARALLADEKPHVADEVLLEQSRVRPNDPGLWYLLAEVQGLSGNIVGVHRARAEYFILNGILDEAERQLNYALKLSRNDYHTAALVNQRLRDITELRQQMQQF